MPFQPFTSRDFGIFDLPGFAERMAAIRSRIRPKLEDLGAELALEVAQVTGTEVFAHVARHARRTVNPPDDTWVALGPDRRGYKKLQHFKVAVSRGGIRFLFEIGPEHAAKTAWARAFAREGPRLRQELARAGHLHWFVNEHDDEPEAALADLDAAGWRRVAEGLTRAQDGQLVLGRGVGSRDAVGWQAADYRAAAERTFGALGGCFRLR